MKKTLMLAVLACLLIAAPASAKSGFYLGVNMLFNDISGEINSPEVLDAGNGLGLRAGFGLNRYLALEGAIWKTEHDRTGGGSTDLKAGTLDLKLNLPLSGSNIEPYVLVGFGRYTLETGSASVNGTGTQFGIGMDIYLFPELSFNAGLTRRNITFDTPGTDEDGKVTSLDFGFTYHFI
ncbi:MAG: porin family protein [Nitrospirota bacterium]|nr:porin family protein [Nitrospirota bacterium]